MPALLTTMFKPPKAAAVCSSEARTPRSSATSQAIGSASPPADWICSAILLPQVDAAPDQRHAGPFGGEQPGRGFADAGGRAADPGHPAGQSASVHRASLRFE